MRNQSRYIRSHTIDVAIVAITELRAELFIESPHPLSMFTRINAWIMVVQIKPVEMNYENIAWTDYNLLQT